MMIKQIMSGLAAIALVMVPLTQACADDVLEKVRDLGKFEAKNWEAASAIFFHVADHDRESEKTTNTDFDKDVEEVNRLIARLKSRNPAGEESVALANIEKHWGEVQKKAAHLMSVDFAEERELAEEDSHLHNYWHAVEALDQEIEKYIATLVGNR